MITNNFNKKIGENIRKQRELKDFSQGKLAKILNVDRSYVSTLEKGSRNPSVKTLEKIAKALGVKVALLLESSKYENAENAEVMPYILGLIKSKESDWKGKKWYHQRFDGSPYLMHMIGEAEIITRRDKKYGLFFDRHFCFYEDGKADWYIDLFEIERVTNRILEISEREPDFGKKLMKEYEPLDKAFYSECEKIREMNLAGLSDRELMNLHDTFLQKILNRNSSSSIIDGFALGTDRMLEEKIRKAYDIHPSIAKASRFSEVFSILTAPPHTSFVREAELELFKLILKLRKHPEKKKELIADYQSRYFWIRNNYVDANILTVQYFQEEIARIESSGLDVANEVERIEKLPEETRKKKQELLKKLNLDKEILAMLSITEDFTQWQDERKKATMFTAHYCTLLLGEISRRVNIPTDLLKYMSPREVSKIFDDTPPVNLLKERQKGSVAYWDDNGHEILAGEIVQTLRKKLLGEKKIDDIQDFRGMAASLGKAQGKVKIIKSVKEIGRIKQGDVLVAVMTRPDYLPAMKKACAIITDEGGITSHAAIVSRELKIPCVIGTKIATQILRDGDIVQVNANHGFVKILECSTRD
ncbi:MAG: PEP-utilizing enzyme [Candidatus Staskawiczbacteria bacterium]